MTELPPAHFERVTSLFEGIELWPSLPHSVIEQNQTGRVFVDDVSAPRAAVVCHSTGYSYVGGENESFAEELERDLFGKISNEVLHLCGTAGYWQDRLRTFMGDSSVPYQMLSYRFDKISYKQLPNLKKLPPGCRMERINESLVELIDQDPESGILWYFDSVDHFSKQGLGYGLFEGNALASFCFTALVGAGWSDPQLKTGELFRRKGYATQVTGEYIAGCLDAGLEPTWHTWPGNTASERIAAHVGFRLIGEFTVYELRRGQRQQKGRSEKKQEGATQLG